MHAQRQGSKLESVAGPRRQSVLLDSAAHELEPARRGRTRTNGAIVDNPNQSRSSPILNQPPTPTETGAAISDAVNLGPGTVLSGRFEIGDLLGAGGMGSVYAARDRMTGQEIAIKVLLPELVASRQDVRKRFMAECLVSRDPISFGSTTSARAARTSTFPWNVCMAKRCASDWTPTGASECPLPRSRPSCAS